MIIEPTIVPTSGSRSLPTVRYASPNESHIAHLNSRRSPRLLALDFVCRATYYTSQTAI
jgi:hypothetical protein